MNKMKRSYTSFFKTLCIACFGMFLMSNTFATVYEVSGTIENFHHCDDGTDTMHVDLGDGNWYMIYHSITVSGYQDDEKAVALLMAAFFSNKSVTLTIDDSRQGTYCSQPKRSYGVIYIAIHK